MKSFREQVKLFWKAFFLEEKKLRNLIDQLPAEQEKVLISIKSLLDICLDQSLFEVGKNSDGRYELVLCANGDPLSLLYHHYIVEKAPRTLQRYWNFYEAKPCVNIDNFSLNIHGKEVAQRDVILYPKLMDQRISLDVYCDVFLKMSLEDAMQNLFLLLDASIGEVYTMNYIGELHIIKEKQNGGITLDLLGSYLKELMSKEAWTNRHDSLQVYTNYTIQPKKENFYLREDVFSGMSTQINLINEMLRFGSYHVKKAEMNGIQLGFLFYEHSAISPQERFLVRESIEEKITCQCAIKQVAENIGAANGIYYTYLDYVVYDWEKFLAILVPIMEDVNTMLYGYQPMIIGEQPLYLVDNRPSGQG